MAKRRAAPKRTKAAARLAAKNTLVVYIHGIAPKPAPAVLKGEWDLSLFGRDMGAESRMAYWADILHDPSDTLVKAVRSARKKRLSQEEIRGEILKDAGVDPNDKDAQEFVDNLLISVGGGANLVRPRGVNKKVIPLPEFLRGPIAEAFLRFFVKDTAAYFFDAKVRKQIKQRLIDQLPTGGEPFILVSHSQGTIVAFEVLSELKRRAKTALLVTLGSPLGLQEVQDELVKSKLSLRVPADVDMWHNFSDMLDPVALDHFLAGDFEARDQVSVKDHIIVNRSVQDLTEFHPHDAAGDLSHPEVRSIVHRVLRYDTSSRFVVARDVAERFVMRTQRQPVLIEVLEPRYWAVGETRDDVAAREKEEPEELQSLEGRVSRLAGIVEQIVKNNADDEDPKQSAKEASILKLRKYVAAHLTPSEIQKLGSRPDEMHVYAVWRSARKRKLLTRSHGPLSADAARQSYASDGRGIRWAVLDTGCKLNHPHFDYTEFGSPTIEHVYDCTTNDSSPIRLDPAKPNHVAKSDRDGHGTHVCGIIAGAGSMKGADYFGVAPRAKLVVYKVLNDDGEGEDAWIIKAIDHIFRHNANEPCNRIHGVNLSLGGPFDATVYGCGFSPICKELRDLWRQGVVVCVAAGNEGQIEVATSDGAFDLNTLLSIGDPANLEDCIAVGSVNTDKPHIYGISYFSSRGPTADGRMKPDVVAPGERIVSCNSEFKPGGGRKKAAYREDSGTSMACPHVSGLIAAFLSVRPEYIGRPDEVKQILLQNCNDLGRDRYHQGAGMPNLMKMLINA